MMACKELWHPSTHCLVSFIECFRGRHRGGRNLLHVCYAAPIGAFFCPEIRAFTGFWGEISSTASKVLSDRKVLFIHRNGR